VTTFAPILERLRRQDSARPLLTYYDHATGERTEFSVVTYANWVAKTASLLTELDVERGSRVRVDLPVHWLGPVLLGAAWTVGAEVRSDGEDADLVVTGGTALERWLDVGVPILASALHPLGLRFTEPPPAPVVDLGVEVWGQPDGFAPWDPPEPSDPALDGRDQAALWADAEGRWPAGTRLLSCADPIQPDAVTDFTGPLLAGGSVVLVANPDPSRLDDLAAAERVTARA
jgi:uncharacterized protein (TIGR03089 family)